MLIDENKLSNGQSNDAALLNIIKQYLDSQNWNYDFDGETFSLGFNLKSDLNSCTEHIIVANDGIYACANARVTADKKAYPYVLEYLNRINYSLIDGSFDFDVSDGSITYTTFLRCNSTIPSFADVESSIDTPFMMLQKYGNGLVKMLNCNGNPLQEKERAEA